MSASLTFKLNNASLLDLASLIDFQKSLKVKVKVMRKDWVIKSVSIEKGDAEIIQQQGPSFNLSSFVRQCLRRYALHKEQLSTAHPNPGVRKRYGFCMPRSMCPKCWPDGPPDSDDWDRYRGVDPKDRNQRQTDFVLKPAEYFGPEVGDRDFLLSTIEPKFSMSEMKVEGNSPSSRKKSKSFIRNMLNFLRL